jgi:hypothetical protein
MNRILTTKTLEDITYGIVNEALRIGGIQFLKRECSCTRAGRSADRGRVN